ncbi:unnamed protein product [Boreogadus saida]
MYALYSREVSEELPLTTAEPRPEEELSIRALPTTGRALVLTPTTSTLPRPVATDYKPRRRGGRTGSRVPVSEERKLFNFSTDTKSSCEVFYCRSFRISATLTASRRLYQLLREIDLVGGYILLESIYRETTEN